MFAGGLVVSRFCFGYKEAITNTCLTLLSSFLSHTFRIFLFCLRSMGEIADEVDVDGVGVHEVRDGVGEGEGEEQGLEEKREEQKDSGLNERSVGSYDPPRRETGEVEEKDGNDGRQEIGEVKGQDTLLHRDFGRSERSPGPRDSTVWETRQVDAADEKSEREENGDEKSQGNLAGRDSGRRERSPRPWDRKSDEDRDDSFIALTSNEEFRAQEGEGEQIRREERQRERDERYRNQRESLKRRSLSPRRESRSSQRHREKSSVRREQRDGEREREGQADMERGGYDRGRRDEFRASRYRERSPRWGRRESKPRDTRREKSLSRERPDSEWDGKRDRSREYRNRRSKFPLPQRRSRRDNSRIRRTRGHRYSSLPREYGRDGSQSRRGRRETSPHRHRGRRDSTPDQGRERRESSSHHQERERKPSHSEAGSVAPHLDYGEPGELIASTSPSSPKNYGKDKDTNDFGRQDRESRIEKRKRSPSRELSPYSKRRQLTQPSGPGVQLGDRSEHGARPLRHERNGREGRYERGDGGRDPQKAPRNDHWAAGDQPRRESRRTNDNRHGREIPDAERENSRTHEQAPDPRFRDFCEEKEERARQRDSKHRHHRGGEHRDSRDHGGREEYRDSRDHRGHDAAPHHRDPPAHHRDSHRPENHRTTYPARHTKSYLPWGHNPPPLPRPRYNINDRVRLRTPLTQREKDYYQPTKGKIRYDRSWNGERPLRNGWYRIVERRYREADLGVLWEYKVKGGESVTEKAESVEEWRKRKWEDGRLEGIWFGENEVVDWEG